MLLPYALTTTAKVKLMLGITDSSKDELIDMLINQSTDFIESLCGGRRFLRTTYENDRYDAPNGSFVFLRQFPIVSIAKAQYRSGTIASPIWNDFNPNYYIPELKAGYVKFYTNFSQLTQPELMLSFDYTAGYLIDFTNEVEPTAHTLPFDLTMLATQLSTGLFNRRAAEGIQQETTEGQSVTYYRNVLDQDLTPTQKAIIGKYQQNRMTT